jgi:hypothetical protein
MQQYFKVNLLLDDIAERSNVGKNNGWHCRVCSEGPGNGNYQWLLSGPE